MKQFFSRIGRRGSFLLFLATLDGLFGYALWLPHTVVAVGPMWLPLRTWSVLWIFVAFICFLQSFMKKDKIAFTLAVALKIGWGSLMLNWWLFHNMMRGWISVTIWWAFAGSIAIIAGWQEPPHLIKPETPHIDSDVLQENS